MNIQGYSFYKPEALPKKKKAGTAKTFALAGIAVLGGVGSTEAAETDRHNNYIIEFPYIFRSLENKSTLTEGTSHIQRDTIIAELKKLFSDLSSYNWDGYGAHPIQEAAYLNAVAIVRNTPENILKLWNVFPAPNGTISFEFKAREVAALSVGVDGFSFAAMKDDKEPIMDEMAFDAVKASKALVRMSNLFGNYDA